MRRNERGITLIALAVTIVVLLILAGVTITYALGDNGIFSKAQNAEKSNALGNARDYMSLTKIDALATYYEDTTASWENATLISKVVEPNFPGCTDVTAQEDLHLTSSGLTGSVTLKLSGYTFKVDFTNNKVTEVN